jgi:hypothetical protein
MYKNDCPASVQFLIERIKKRVTEIHTPVIRFDHNAVGSKYIEGIDRLTLRRSRVGLMCTPPKKSQAHLESV